MQNPSAENDWLTRARQAAKLGNATAAQMYFSTFLTRNPDNGKVFTEFLDAMRGMQGANRQLTDVPAQSALTKLLPSQPSLKIMEASLEKLRTTPFDLDAVMKIARSAQTAGWLTLAIVAFTDVLRLSPSAKIPGSKLGREIKLTLGQVYFQRGEYKLALETLKDFEQDPAAGKEIQQIIKDASANLASATFAQKDSAHQIATATSVTLATQTPQQKAEQEMNELLELFSDSRTDQSKVCTAALRIADIHLRGQNLESALQILHQARERVGQNGDVSKKIVEIEIRRRDQAINVHSSKTDPSLSKLIAERDDYVVKAYSELAATIPTDADVHLRLGEGLFALSKRSNDEALLKEAIVHLQFDFKTDEQFSQSRLLLAECFLALQLPAAAEIVLTELLARIDSTRKGECYLDAQYLLGIVRERLKDSRGAMTAFMIVIGKNIKFKDAFDRLKRLDASRALSA